MNYLKTAAFLAALNVTAPSVTIGLSTVLPTTANACTLDCNQPTGVGKGNKVPVWKVLYCIIGPADGDFERIDCQDPRAVHLSPRGKPAVCFIGSDGKPHWDRQENVVVGRSFINQKVSGIWYINWK